MMKGALAAGLLLVGAQAPAAWFEARTDHFIVYSEDDEADTRAFTAKLERFDKAMRKLHGLSDDETQRANPLTVYVLPGTGSIQRICAGVKPTLKAQIACQNVGGFYINRVSGALAFTPRYASGGKGIDYPLITLLHEYAHHIMFAYYAAAYPAWFVEGFAEFNSTARVDRKGSVGFGLAAKARAYGVLEGKRLTVEKLLVSRPSGSSDDLDIFYGQGWLLTHYLTFEKSRAGQLQAYLAEINKGTPSLEAGKRAFGDLGQLDKDLDRYLGQPGAYVELPIDEAPDSAIVLRRLTPGEQAMMPVRMRSDRGVSKEGAPALAEDARRAAAPFPDDAGAQLALAEAEFDAGNETAAGTAADRALTAAPDSYGALLFKGKAQMLAAQKAEIADDAVWRKIRSLFIRANRLEKNGAEALWLFYLSYKIQGIAPTANAIAALESASAYAPQDGIVRTALATEYLREDKLAAARAVLVPLAFDPHAETDNSFAAIVALIDKGDRQAIRAFLDAKPGAPASDKADPAK